MERSEAVKFVRAQLERDGWLKPNANSRDDAGKNDRVHYGKCELRELMDAIYGGPPRSKEEEL